MFLYGSKGVFELGPTADLKLHFEIECVNGLAGVIRVVVSHVKTDLKRFKFIPS